MERAAAVVSPAGRYADDRAHLVSVLRPLQVSTPSNRTRVPRTLGKHLLPQSVSSVWQGLGVRSTVVIGQKDSHALLATTELRRWPESYRPHLFHVTQYAEAELTDPSAAWPRLGHPEVARLYEALMKPQRSISEAVTKGGPAVGHKKIALYYLSVFVEAPSAWTADGRRIDQHESAICFESKAMRDVAFTLLSGRLAFWWWTMNGDDFNVPSHILKSFPINPAQVKSVENDLIALAAELRAEQPRQPSVTLYAGKEIGNYHLNRCRHITDRAERLVLQALGLANSGPRFYSRTARSQKATGEQPELREWPFGWEPGSSR